MHNCTQHIYPGTIHCRYSAEMQIAEPCSLMKTTKNLICVRCNDLDVYTITCDSAEMLEDNSLYGSKPKSLCVILRDLNVKYSKKKNVILVSISMRMPYSLRVFRDV